MVPFVDLKRQHTRYQSEIDDAIRQTFSESRFILGESVSRFETSLAQYLKVDNVVSCGSGTDALELILKGYNIGSGDEVIIPAHTWVSNAEAVCNVGATPVFADVSGQDFNIDPAKVEQCITSNTKAIMAVHLYGQSCNMEELLAIAKLRDIKVIEDVAQALGAEYNGKKLGGVGHAAAHSFYPTKNLGACGDAGAISTSDSDLAKKIRLITNHGQSQRDVHEINGRNSRMDTIQAAILNVKLRYLDEMNQLRSENSGYYSENLKHAAVDLPVNTALSSHCNHIYAIRCANRDALKAYLASKGIITAVHYPTALPNMKPYKAFANGRYFAVATDISQSQLSLPIFPGLSEQELDDVCKAILDFFNK